MATHLNNHHRRTVEKVFQHPTFFSPCWWKTSVSGPIVTVDKQSVTDLRRILAQAGLATDGSAPVSDERTRNYGDDRRGKPTQD